MGESILNIPLMLIQAIPPAWPAASSSPTAASMAWAVGLPGCQPLRRLERALVVVSQSSPFRCRQLCPAEFLHSSAAVWPSRDSSAWYFVGGVVLRDGQFPQVLVQVTRAELASGHEISYCFLQCEAVDDCQQVARLVQVPASHLIQGSHQQSARSIVNYRSSGASTGSVGDANRPVSWVEQVIQLTG